MPCLLMSALNLSKKSLKSFWRYAKCSKIYPCIPIPRRAGRPKHNDIFATLRMCYSKTFLQPASTLMKTLCLSKGQCRVLKYDLNILTRLRLFHCFLKKEWLWLMCIQGQLTLNDLVPLKCCDYSLFTKGLTAKRFGKALHAPKCGSLKG